MAICLFWALGLSFGCPPAEVKPLLLLQAKLLLLCVQTSMATMLLPRMTLSLVVAVLLLVVAVQRFKSSLRDPLVLVNLPLDAPP
jgi:hypothetical protein